MDGGYSICLRTRLGIGFAIFSPRKADLNVKSFTLIPHQSTTASCVNTFLVLHFNSSVDKDRGDFSCCIFHNVKHLSSAEEGMSKAQSEKVCTALASIVSSDMAESRLYCPKGLFFLQSTGQGCIAVLVS